MKERCKRTLAAMACACGALGWWGVLYPQLSLLPDTYRIISAEEAVQDGQEVVEWDFEGGIYMDLLNAGPERIRFRSGLWECLTDCLDFWKKE